MSLRTTFRFESNGVSFELTGSEDYVRKYLPLFLPLVGSAAGVEAKAASAQAQPEARAASERPETLKDWYERHAGRGTRPTMQDHILVFALWMRSFRKFIFTSEDIRRAFDELGLTTPKSLLQILGTLKRDRNLILGTERRGGQCRGVAILWRLCMDLFEYDRAVDVDLVEHPEHQLDFERLQRPDRAQQRHDDDRR